MCSITAIIVCIFEHVQWKWAQSDNAFEPGRHRAVVGAGRVLGVVEVAVEAGANPQALHGLRLAFVLARNLEFIHRGGPELSSWPRRMVY